MTHRENLWKTGLVYFSAMFILAGSMWSLLYYLLGFTLPALIPGSYSALSLLTRIFVLLTGKYLVFRFFQFLLILILPVLLQLSLGGFVNSGAVMIWSILSPLGALAFAPARQSIFWFALFALMVLFSGLAEAFFPLPVPLVSQNLRTIFFATNIAAVGALTFSSLFYFIAQSKQEHDRAESLLLNVLPEPIARRLKVDTSTIADAYPMASILFADLVGFTSMSGKVTPDKLVNFLNSVFSHFDTLADKYQMEKIKTIGDAYMAVAGVPVSHERHADNAIEMAGEMLKFINSIKDPVGNPLQMRIGIHSGSVVAGVIGRKKFIYDLWGDAVNTASRLESHGVPGALHISEQTYALLTEKTKAVKRGVIEIKGIGPMTTYVIRGNPA